MTNEELEKIIKNNQLVLARIEIKLAKISKQMLWSKIGGVLKIVLILGPIIIGILYLSPFIKQYSGSFQSLFSGLRIYTGGYDDQSDKQNNNADNQTNSAIQADLIRDFCDAEKREVYVRNFCQ